MRNASAFLWLRFGAHAAAITVALATASSAAAVGPTADGDDFAPPGAAAGTGATIKDEPGFQLFTHRVWLGPRLSAPARPEPARRPGAARWNETFAAARANVVRLIELAERRHGLPAGLLDALVATESAYRPFAVSAAGAQGLAQLMPGTARSLGVSDSFDVVANLDGGARYLRAMIDRFGSISLGLAAYNAGPGAVKRWAGIPNNGETPAYVARVLSHWRALRAFQP